MNNCTKFPNLQEIDFAKNRISDKGFVAFGKISAKLPNLKRINFGLNRITDVGMIDFANNSSLYANL